MDDFTMIGKLIEQFGVAGASVVVAGGLFWKTLSMIQGASRLLWPKVEKAFDNFDLIAKSIEALAIKIEKLDSDQSSVLDISAKTLDNTHEILSQIQKSDQRYQKITFAGDEKFPGGER